MSSKCDIWAKSADHGQTAGESLVAHTLAVIERVKQLRQRAPFLPGVCDEPRLWHRLALAVAIHDLGKVDPAFQAVLRENSKTPPPQKKPRFTLPPLKYEYRHEILSLAWLDWLLGDDLAEDRFWIAAAVASHHRDCDFLKSTYPLTAGFGVTSPAVKNFVETVPVANFEVAAKLALDEILPRLAAAGLLDPGWSAPAGWNYPEDQVHGAAIKSIRRHLGPWYEQFYRPFNEDGEIDPQQRTNFLKGQIYRGLIILADHAGSAHEDFKQLSALLEPGEMNRKLFPGNQQQFPHQAIAAETTGHAILSAPTGSGKTEAALQWAARQYAEPGRGQPPLFYVLPYKASMNAMQQRLEQRLVDDPETTPHLITLQHSSAMQVLYHELMSEEGAESESQVEEPAEPQADGSSRGERTQSALKQVRHHKNLSRLHTTPVRVLSPYQILRAAYQLKGHEALWTDATGGVFIFDEIHAYEPERLGRILGMLQYMVQQLQARVLFMTATMPAPVRRQLEQVLGGNVQTLAADQQTYQQFQRHRLQLSGAGLLDDCTVERILDRIEHQETVLCVATTVSRAQELQKKIQQRLEEKGNPSVLVDLLHSRFSGCDRAQKEADLRALVSTQLHGRRERQVVLVATQVVEVSLDVDFDVLFTDPAPLEALVQRFGRINRGRREKYRDVIVCTPIEDALPVYCRPMVEAAISQLTQACSAAPEGRLLIDEHQVQVWLDDIYSGEIGTWLEQALIQTREVFEKSVLSLMAPFQTKEKLKENFYEKFDGQEILPECYVEKYLLALGTTRTQKNTIEAAQYTVPVSFKQFMQLKRQGVLKHPSEFGLSRYAPHVVLSSVPYSPESGLQISFSSPAEAKANDDT